MVKRPSTEAPPPWLQPPPTLKEPPRFLADGELKETILAFGFELLIATDLKQEADFSKLIIS